MDLKHFRMAALRRCMAVVPQPAAAFSGSVRENLLLGGVLADDAAIARSLKQAAFGSVLARLPAGLQEEIGERGLLLSEGERQRLAIARAMLRRAPILLLDEPSSALDGDTEEQVVSGLKQVLSGGYTAVLISHRPAPLRLAHRILVLADGRVADEGNFSELVIRSGLFRAYLDSNEI